MKNNKSRYMLALSMMLLMGLFVISCGSKDVNPTSPNITEDGQTGTVSTIEGTGSVDLLDADAGDTFTAYLSFNIDTTTLSESHLSVLYETGALQSENSSITSVTKSTSGDVIIEGSGTAEYYDSDTGNPTDSESCTFTLTLTDADADGNPESVSVELIESATGDILVSFTTEPFVNSTITITY